MKNHEKITRYCYDIVNSTSALYEKKLYGQMLIIIYSSVDSLGLLGASPDQTRASSNSFKEWVKKYLLSGENVNFSDVDFWGARCSILHTFTSQSDLSDRGAAKEIQYYSGPKDSEEAISFRKKISSLNTGNHIAVHIEDTYLAFMHGMKKFVEDLTKLCDVDTRYEDRLNRIIQRYAI